MAWIFVVFQLINRFLAEDDFDADTQFCLHWFEQHGWTENIFGEADVLARSKSTSVDAMKEAGVLQSGSGKVRLLKWAEYPTDWDPRTDDRTPVWEHCISSSNCELPSAVARHIRCWLFVLLDEPVVYIRQFVESQPLSGAPTIAIFPSSIR